MNIIQFFHSKKVLPMFNIGDKVRLKKGNAFERVRRIYNKEYPNCYCGFEKWQEIWVGLNKRIGYGEHIITGVKEGTPAAGGWFVSVESNESLYFHGNIFELVK